MADNYDRDLYYAIEGAAMNSLRTVMLRLYDDRSLSPDERRDLANKMEAVLSDSLPLEE